MNVACLDIGESHIGVIKENSLGEEEKAMTRETRTLCSQEAIAMIRGTSDDIIGYLPKTK